MRAPRSHRRHRAPALAAAALLVLGCAASGAVAARQDVVAPLECTDVDRSDLALTPARFLIGSIVTFRPGSTDADVEEAKAYATAQGGVPYATYRYAFKGFATTLTAEALAGLADNHRVLRIDPEIVECLDRPIRGKAPQSSAGPSAASLPPVVPATWGLDRIDQRSLPLDGSYTAAGSGRGVRAYVVDSGIRAAHEQFGGRVVPGIDLYPGSDGTEDCDGHGTHVAGTIGAARLGVAPEVTLVDVRTFDCDGTSLLSTILSGLDWIALQKLTDNPGPSVVNLSLGAGGSSLHEAVAGLLDLGVVVVSAAGNSGGDACAETPAGNRRALTVGASTRLDARAGFSNFGTCVDLFAPGEDILSTSWTDDAGVEYLSGTSMAAPHVAGVAAQILGERPDLTPAQVAGRIKNTATKKKLTAVGGAPNLLLFSTL
ncbi:MAG: S8 family serine peptidase [Sporichthyaceae bacterium]